MAPTPSIRMGGTRPAVGLDIGSSAVRAVELRGDGPRPKLRAAGQVGLRPGVVVDGEVRQPEALAEALKRLWSEGGFSTRRVVVGAGGQRVIVREADVTAMSAADFRSAMSFEVQDLIPIPVSDALLDFQILGAAEPAGAGRARMRILLAAASRDSVQASLQAVRLAGLDPVAVDVAPAAMVRPLPAGPETTCLVSVGAHLTSVTVRTGGGSLYNRTLAVGAERLTEALVTRLGVAREEAEAVKRYATTAGAGAAATRVAGLVDEDATGLVQQILESIEYFESHEAIGRIDQLVLAGGGTLAPQVVLRLQEGTDIPIGLADPLAAVDTSDLVRSAPGLDLGRLRPLALGAVGLAMWPATPASGRLSLLPGDLVEARQRRQTATAAAAGIGVVVVALGGMWYHRHTQIAGVDGQTASIQAHSQALRDSNASLRAVTAFTSAVEARQSALAADAGDVDWPALVRQIEGAMPAGDVLSSINLSTAAPASSSGAPAASTAAAPPQLTLSVQANGGEDSLATWLRAMGKVPSLGAIWVASASSTGGATTFSANATVTAKAPKLSYPWEAHK